MEENKFEITSHDLANLREVFNALHSVKDPEEYDEEREIYPPSREIHTDPGHPDNRIPPILNETSVMHIGVDNIDGLAKLLMTIQYDDAKLKARVDKARDFLRRLIEERVVTDWKPVFPGLRSRGYFRSCMKASSEDERLLAFYHGSWRTVTAIEEQSDSEFAVCSFANPYPETSEARPILKIKARYDSLYIIAFKELEKLRKIRSEDREFFVLWLSAAMKMVRARKEHFINVEAMFSNPVFAS